MSTYHETVSICTPTYNRRRFINNLISIVINQDYPKHLLEWVIVDDGEDKVEDIIEKSKSKLTDVKVVYIKLPTKVALGKKRNIMHEHTSGDIIVYMDDDDYYPPSRVSHAVDMLTQYPDKLCAGCSKIYVYFIDRKQIYRFGPYHNHHATANTFAFRREFLKQTRYEDRATFSEEKYFLKNYSVPIIQLNTLKTILVISHNSNTYDKNQIIKYSHKSKKAMDHFIGLGFSSVHYTT